MPSHAAGPPQPVAGAERMLENRWRKNWLRADSCCAMKLRLARSVDIAMVGGSDALYVGMQHAPYSIETTATICAAVVRKESSFRMSIPAPGRSDRQRIPLSTNGKTLGDGIGAGAR